MEAYMITRASDAASKILEGKSIREAAALLKVSKSTVHKDVSERLPRVNAVLAEQVAKVLRENFDTKHIKGGNATKLKYASGATTSQSKLKRVK